MASSNPVILIIDDEEAAFARLSLVLEKGFEGVSTPSLLFAKSLTEAIEMASRHPLDVVFLDKELKDPSNDVTTDGIKAIPSLLQLRPHAQILVFTGSRDTKDVERAMLLGASGYIRKDEPDQLILARARQAIAQARSTTQLYRLSRAKDLAESKETWSFGSTAMKVLQAKLSALAESDRPVLLLGETGVGKTSLGRLIHNRRVELLNLDADNFQYFNIQALPQGLIESELFGHEAGSFTGAGQRRIGFCELANNGTLFIDEIGEASLDVQAKLLTVLSESTLYRVGGTKPIHTAFKLVCATNRDLRKMVSDGTFREDLYYRICVLEVRIPSLIERREEIEDLIRILLPRVVEKNRVNVAFDELPSDLISFLSSCPPKGNIRGLENLLTRLLVNAPRSRRGRCILSDWRDLIEQREMDSRAFQDRVALSIDDLLSLKFTLDKNRFPGIDEVLRTVERKLVEAALVHVDTAKDLAELLGRTKSSVSMRYRELVGREAKKRKQRLPAGPARPSHLKEITRATRSSS